MSALKIENIRFESSWQNQPVAGFLFYDPDVAPCAILQISHGMAEYILRYRNFAEYLVKHGYVICGNDHLGHGATSGSEYPDGFFSPKNGRYHLLKDLHTMNQVVRSRYPGLPLVLFGHSMGSFYARWFAEKYPNDLDAVVYCGTSGKNPAAPAAVLLTKVIQAFYGPMHRSKLCYQAAFGAYLKKIPNPTSQNDWLSVNAQNVADYDNDPKCGFMFTVSAFGELTSILSHVNSDQWYKAVPKQLPVLVTAGMEDPVGNYGQGPTEVAELLRQNGVEQVQLKLYDGMRHEILNEEDCAVVYADILAWCNRVLKL
ncbi:MAG: alpha/beta fold hydrolase [Faecalibacterium sp.]|nr:alpha/beta fold hydrolase [Faecalibacterium sp.]